MCNKLNAAANAVAAGDHQDAIDQLQSLVAKLGQEGPAKDWMVPSLERDALAAEIAQLISLLEYLL